MAENAAMRRMRGGEGLKPSSRPIIRASSSRQQSIRRAGRGEHLLAHQRAHHRRSSARPAQSAARGRWAVEGVIIALRRAGDAGDAMARGIIVYVAQGVSGNRARRAAGERGFIKINKTPR